jgi:hypothetical protein
MDEPRFGREKIRMEAERFSFVHRLQGLLSCGTLMIEAHRTISRGHTERRSYYFVYLFLGVILFIHRATQGIRWYQWIYSVMSHGKADMSISFP